MLDFHTSIRHGTGGRGLLIPILMLVLSSSLAQADQVHVIPYQGPITPVASEFLTKALAEAEARHAVAAIIQLDTPGGLDSAMRQIVKAELAAKVPVIVYVAPGGSRAASAGAFITLAAHVAVMAPGTNMGSASPVQMGGASMDSTMSHKVTNDAAAYIASIAQQLGRDPVTARAFVTDALNLTADEALKRNVIEIIAPTLPALLDSLQGRTIVIDDTEQVLETTDASIFTHEMSNRLKLLKRLANPNIAYLLMLLGIYGLFFELSNPGAFAPGIIGGICLLLALFAFQALPVDYTGVALILLGVIMLVLEVKVASYGALSIGGLAALVLGSLMLFDSSEQWARLSLKVLVPSVLVFGGFFMLCIWLVIRSRKRPVTTGPAGMIGDTGRVVTDIGGGSDTGKVVLHGEMWDAVADQPIVAGSQVDVVKIEGRIARVVLKQTSG